MYKIGKYIGKRSMKLFMYKISKHRDKHLVKLDHFLFTKNHNITLSKTQIGVYVLHVTSLNRQILNIHLYSPMIKILILIITIEHTHKIKLLI